MTSVNSQPGQRTAAPASPADALVAGLAAELGGAQELEPLLERFLDPVMALSGARAGAVRVLTDDGRHLRLVGQRGLPAALLATERLVRRDCGMCGVAAAADTLAWVSDVASCAAHNQGAYFGLECRRVLAISLPHAGQVLGVYNLFFEDPPELGSETETILRLTGQLLGLALHNARIERERTRMTVMKERQEMVNEVHDAIAQTLAYVKMRLPLLSSAMLAHDDERALKVFGDVKKAVGEVHHNLREVMTYFRTRMDPLGLLHALQGLADGFRERTGIALEIRNTARNLGLDDEQEVQVFHIVQEALANIAKHAMASHAVLAIARTPRGLEFLIEDDGMGLSAPPRLPAGSADASHLGLGIMQARAQRLGGTIEVGAVETGGTRVRLVLAPAAAGMTGVEHPA